MDWRSVVLFVVIIFALFWLIMRLRGSVRNPPKLQMAMDMISAHNDYLRIIRQKESAPEDLKKFKVGNWKVFKDHLDFMDKEYIEALKSSFSQMTEYNNKLVQMKISTDNSKPQIDLNALKTTAVKARAGLAKWIQENVHREATKGLFSWRN
jgi:hypothetical protein